MLPAGQEPPPRAGRAPSRRGLDPADEPHPPDEPLDPFADVHPGSRDLLLRATIDNDRPFVGQQISYSLYLLARINVSGIDKLQLPRLDGFWTEEIEAPQQLVGEGRILDGVPYRSFLLRKRALFALHPGRTVIEPAEVEVLTGFGMLFSRGSARRQSQSVSLEVQPLPPGKPLGFDPGNVGQWTLTSTADPAIVSVGQPVTFRLVATGRGNVRDLRLPRLPAIPGLRAYDATTTDKEIIEKGLVSGTRTVEQLLVPERTGLMEVPALAMDVFDPVQKAYRALHTDSIRVQVTPAAAGRASAEPLAQNLLAAGGVRPIRLRFGQASRSPPPWTRPWFWPLLALPPFGLALLLAGDRARRKLAIDPQQRRIKLARSQARKRLRGAQALLAKGEAAAFYAEVGRAITGYLADKQGIVAAGLTREELSRALAARGHAEETVRRVVRALDANAAYLSGDLPRAIVSYEALVAEGITSPELETNLGAAYLRQGRRGPAALHFERALFLDSSDDDARADLVEVRRGNVDRLEGESEEGGTETLARVLAPLPGATAAVLFVALWLAAWVLLGVRGPGEKSASHFEVHEGTTVRVEDEEGQFRRVKLANGLTGWVPSAAVELVVPPGWAGRPVMRAQQP